MTRVSSHEEVTSVLQPGVKSSNKHKALCGLQKIWPSQPGLSAFVMTATANIFLLMLGILIIINNNNFQNFHYIYIYIYICIYIYIYVYVYV